MLTSSNVPLPATGDSPDPALWLVGTTYAVGNRVHIAGTTNKIYESIQATNLGKDPTDAANILWWVEVGAVNRWRMFDSSNTSQTTGVGGLDVSLTLAQVYNSLALLNVSGASSIRVRQTDAVDGVVSDQTIAMQAPPSSAEWYNYFFDTITNKTSANFDLKTYGSAVLRIEIIGAGVVGCGVAVTGRKRAIGLGVEMGARVGIQDYSRKERNAFGDMEVTERAYSKRADFSMLLNASEVDSLIDFLAYMRATPSVWVGSSKYGSTTIYGFYKSFDITLQYADYAACTLSLEGLI
jgi:hypothetical protein